MTGRGPQPEITIFAGLFGSGKTEVAINFALSLAQKAGAGPASGLGSRAGVVLIDLDIVTPYFRSRETADAMRERGVEVVAPSPVGQHLDTPAITPQILGAIQQWERQTVVDVGGDRQGARALGQFSAAIRQRGYTFHFVANSFRPGTGTAEELTKSISEIEGSARLQVTDLVSNPNLMDETTVETIREGHSAIQRFAGRLGLPVAFVCVEDRWAEAVGSNHFEEPILVLERFFVQPWE
jgi:hypothetical protein